MGPLPCLTDPPDFITADTSAIINLNATGRAAEILRALPNRLMVVDVVHRELEEGRVRGRRDADLLEALVAADLAQIAELGDVAAVHFEKLVVGPAASTLDDGEAATISCAVARGGIAILDERKATRLCADLFPDLCVACTVDLLRHPRVQDRLGRDALVDAVFRALRDGRMRVFPHHIEWVVGLIGPERAAECASLPGSIRRPQQLLLRARGVELDHVENE
jgi:predicted nucleic acid-binding protein